MASLKRSAVVFWDVDTQFDFMRPKGKLYVKGAASIIPMLKRVTRFITEHDLNYRATMDVHVKDDPEFKDFAPHCIVGTRGMMKIPETSAGRVFKKSTYDIFSEMFMDEVINGFKNVGITTVIVYGVATDYCVKAAALGFAKRGFRVFVLEDAIAGVERSSTAAAIAGMKAAGIKFRAFDAVTKMFHFRPVPLLADLSKHVDATSWQLMKRDGLELALTKKAGSRFVTLELRKHGAKVASVQVYVCEQPEVERDYGLKRDPVIDAWVQYVLVEKGYRGRGYASILLRAWTRYFDAHGMATGLEATPLMSKGATISLADLVAFYESLGYRVVKPRIHPADKFSAMMFRPRPRAAVPRAVVPAGVPRRAVAAPSFDRTLALAARAGL
jgi:nicotinamidase/pyrazinamidase